MATPSVTELEKIAKWIGVEALLKYEADADSDKDALSINDVWPAVEKLRSLGYLVEIKGMAEGHSWRLGDPADTDRIWACEAKYVWLDRLGPPDILTVADTAANAILRTALAAMEHPENISWEVVDGDLH